MNEEKINKLKDIHDVTFGENLAEITSSLEILLMLLHIDSDPEIIFACKTKLLDGIGMLKQLGFEDTSKKFEM